MLALVLVVEMVPPRFSEVPAAVVEIVPVLVVEIVPDFVVEIVPVFEKAVIDKAKINMAEQMIGLKVFIIFLLARHQI